MKFLTSAPMFVFSAFLAAGTALSSNTYASCSSCGSSQRAPEAKSSIFDNTPSRVTKREIFPANAQPVEPQQSDWRTGFRRPIFGTNDCSRNEGPIFGTNDCTRRKCGGAMFGPQTCRKIELPCEDCKKAPEKAPRNAFIQNYKTMPAQTIYEKIHKCSELAPFQLEWVDFRLSDGASDSYSRKLGNYRFRLFGCRRFSKQAMLNEGRIIQKDMEFIDIFEDIVKDCYNIVKVPTDLCLREQDYQAPEYILTAEISDYFMNICDGYNWDKASATDKRSGSAEMTVTWRLLDLTKTKVIWKGETNGYSEVEDGRRNGEMDLIERAFADAVLNLKGSPEFEAQLARRVDPDTLEQQKTTLLALEQAIDPVKCKIAVPQASTCPVSQDLIGTDGGAYSAGGQSGQCPMSAEMIEYRPDGAASVFGNDTIPLEQGGSRGSYYYDDNNGNVCYGYNNEGIPTLYARDDSTGGYQSTGYLLTEDGGCVAPVYTTQSIDENGNIIETQITTETQTPTQDGIDLQPQIVSFVAVEPEKCQNITVTQPVVLPEESPRLCSFTAEQPISAGGISIDKGYYVPEVDVVDSETKVSTTADWQPYDGSALQTETTIITEGGSSRGNDFCIENAAPAENMNPENLYRIRMSMMTVRNPQGKEGAGLLIADDLILTSADLIDDETGYYNIETINGTKTTARLVRVNVKKNTALLQAADKMYFQPLSLNLQLPQTGADNYMSLGLMDKAKSENYLDDKGSIKGYRFSEEMGTEIITDTFVQTVSSGGALIDERGVIAGIASRTKRYDDSGDLFLPIQDAVNSVGLKICGQTDEVAQIPTAVVPSVSSLIDSNTGSKDPSVMAKSKRK